jgi:hypothetical protein
VSRTGIEVVKDAAELLNSNFFGIDLIAEALFDLLGGLGGLFQDLFASLIDNKLMCLNLVLLVEDESAI